MGKWSYRVAYSNGEPACFVLMSGGVDVCDLDREELADRIVACLNACSGIASEKLVVYGVKVADRSTPDTGKVPLLVEAAKDAMAYIVELGLEGLEAPIVRKLDSAIMAAEGGSHASV